MKQTKLNANTEALANRNDIRVIKLRQGGGELYGYLLEQKA